VVHVNSHGKQLSKNAVRRLDKNSPILLAPARKRRVIDPACDRNTQILMDRNEQFLAADFSK